MSCHGPEQLAAYVKSPVASLCFDCSSVKYLVKVMISVLMASPTAPPLFCSWALIVIV